MVLDAMPVLTCGGFMLNSDDGYVKVGDSIPNPRPAAFQLVIEDYVQVTGGIRPRDYFITSGDAVSKARVLRKDMLALGTDEGNDAAAAAGRLIEALVAVRGDAIFLEVEWDLDHRLLCIPKNPRSKVDPV